MSDPAVTALAAALHRGECDLVWYTTAGDLSVHSDMERHRADADTVLAALRADPAAARAVAAALDPEPRAAALAEVRERVEGLPSKHVQYPPIDGPWVDVVPRASVLLIIEEVGR